MVYVNSGIQQIGIGIPDVKEAFKWYRRIFGTDIPMFEEAAEANLMLPYTGGKPHQRHAILAINLQSGGGFEIWQYTSRSPELPDFEPACGDLGIYIAKIKAENVERAYSYMKEQDVDLLTDVVSSPVQGENFFLKDPWGNIFQVVKGYGWFAKGKRVTGGAFGAWLGVSDMETSLKFYNEILGYDEIIYDESGHFSDLERLPGGGRKLRRVLLKHSKPRTGKFSRMLGPSELELVQSLDEPPRKIFENRFWGDRGFIHLCFDITGMDALRSLCKEKGHPFTVDSFAALQDRFDMGEAAGHFSYIEDPDGSLIEFVEAHKIPLIKKIGWYLDLRKRKPEKPLPNWMLKSLRFMRVKD